MNKRNRTKIIYFLSLLCGISNMAQVISNPPKFEGNNITFRSDQRKCGSFTIIPKTDLDVFITVNRYITQITGLWAREDHKVVLLTRKLLSHNEPTIIYYDWAGGLSHNHYEISCGLNTIVDSKTHPVNNVNCANYVVITPLHHNVECEELEKAKPSLYFNSAAQALKEQKKLNKAAGITLASLAAVTAAAMTALIVLVTKQHKEEKGQNIPRKAIIKMPFK